MKISDSKIIGRVTFFGCLFLCLFFNLQAMAEESSRNNIRAGIFNFDGYHSKKSDGTLEGYGIELLNLLSQYSQLNFILSGYDKSWEDMQKMLLNGEIDVVTSARRTPERQQMFAFSQPVGRNFTLLSARLDNGAIKGGDYKSYNGKKIGVLKGSSQNNDLAKFAREKGFTYELVEFDDPKLLTESLQNGDVDLIMSSNLRKSMNEKVVNIIKMDNFYAIARKEDQYIIDEINYALEQMNLNEGDWQNKIYFKYYGPEAKPFYSLSDREQNFIKQMIADSKKIEATARPDTPPYSFVENGQLKGIIPDYFKKIMSKLDVPYELITPRDKEDYNKLSENVDIVLDRIRPLNVYEKDLISGYTTNPYLVTGLARVMRSDLNKPIRKVAIPEENLFGIDPDLVEGVEIVKLDSPTEAMQAVVNGDVDAAYVFPYTAQRFVNNLPDNTLYYTMVNDKGASLKMLVPDPYHHELVTILNKAIKNMPVGTINQLTSIYTTANAKSLGIIRYLRAHPGLLASLCLAVTMLVSIILFLFLKGRWNRRLLKATETANRKLGKQLAIVEALSRDYLNVLAINEEEDSARAIKLQGDFPEDIIANPNIFQSYTDIIQKYINSFVYPEDREGLMHALSLQTIYDNLADKNEYSGVYRVGDANHQEYYQYTFVSVKEGNHIKNNFILAGFRNIDEIIQREQEQKQILEEALAQAEYANAAKTSFLNNMSHDIRTPMNAIIGFTTLASTHIKNTSLVQRYLSKILTSGNHLLSLINDVLDMSRIESGKVQIEEKETSLPEILQDLRTIVQADVKAKQLDFQITTNNLTNEIIYCDRLRLNQVLLNIISNAMKYTLPGGSVRVDITQETTGQNDAAVYTFKVSDTGIGMSKEFLKNVFEPFEREQSSTVSGIQGTGLGLAITRNIVDMMGGSISVESELNKGSQFTVRFIFKVQDQAGLNTPLPHLKDKKVLVVDDDVETCTSLCRMLGILGLRADWTTLGKEAIIRNQFAQEQHEPFDAYFIDWIMPDMNGIEVARQIRKVSGPDAPIYIITAYDWLDMEEDAKEAGVTAFCSKPIFLSRLKELFINSGKKAEMQNADPDRELFLGKRILLAEDNEMNQEIAQMILEDAGFEIDIVNDGAEAVQKMKSVPEDYYTMILMDVQMPIMDGYSATREIRKFADRKKASIPILAMTANAFVEDKEEAIKSGMNGYVAKPIDIEQLMTALRGVVTGKLGNLQTSAAES